MARTWGSVAVIFILLLSGALPLLAYAQEATATDEEMSAMIELDTGGAETTQSGAGSCFEYYSFGSVQAKIATDVTSAVSGSPVVFSGVLENANDYPIVDGTLYVKVFRQRAGLNDGNGPDVVDQFPVKSDIVIPAKGWVPVTFQWKVPASAVSGEYTLATFFTTSRKFNLLGLSFTDDIVGNIVPFTVSAEAATGVSFDKTTATVNGAAYRFAVAPPQSNATSTVLAARVRNTSSESESAKVSWVVYYWDAHLRENVVQEESATVTVPARGTAPVSITVTDTQYPVYYAVATMEWEDSKSILGMRFVRDVTRTRINFPGVSTFPLKAGERATLFSCVHAVGGESANGRLELTLTDLDGTLIKSHVFEGAISTAMMGIAEAFTPERNHDAFVLEARLYAGGEFVDEAHLVYDCALINPSLCSAGEEAEAADSLLSFIMGDSRAMTVAAGGGLLVLLILAFALLRTLRRRAEAPLPPPHL